jgi:glycosyltransferase involved in cell wall biosynthesis
MAGTRGTTIPTPGEFLAEYFARSRTCVFTASASPSRIGRLFDMLRTILVHRSRIDILVLSVYVGQSFVVEDVISALGWALGKPVVMVLHNGLTPAFVSIFPRWSERVFRRASALVAPSEFLPRALRPFGWDVRTIPNPIDLSKYPFRSRQFASTNLLWMRSFYPYYNPQMAVRTLTHLKKKHPDLSLVMAGKDKGLQATVTQLAVELGVAANIIFPGFLTETAKIAQFERADIFINTNNVDNAPVSIVEAWAMGVPVISTSVGGISDLVKDGETGLLVPDDDDQAMAQAVDRLLQSPNLAKKLSTNGREQAEKFTWERVRCQWEILFAEVMARN